MPVEIGGAYSTTVSRNMKNRAARSSPKQTVRTRCDSCPEVGDGLIRRLSVPALLQIDQQFRPSLHAFKVTVAGHAMGPTGARGFDLTVDHPTACLTRDNAQASVNGLNFRRPSRRMSAFASRVTSLDAQICARAQKGSLS